MYISDGWNQRIRKVTVSTGIITTIAGTGATYLSGSIIVGGYSGDNGAVTSAELSYPWGVALDSTGSNASVVFHSIILIFLYSILFR